MPASAACRTTSTWSTMRGISDGPGWVCRSPAPCIRRWIAASRSCMELLPYCPAAFGGDEAAPVLVQRRHLRIGAPPVGGPTDQLGRGQALAGEVAGERR